MLVVAILETLALAHLWISSGPVLLSKPSDDRKWIAQVAMTRDFPYLSVQGYLEVREVLTGRLHQRHFLVARDVFDDVATEVHSLEWRGQTIVLDIDRTHYEGPKEYEVTPDR